MDFTGGGVETILQEAFLQERNCMQRTFLDWHAVWWVEIILYCVVFAGWAVCWYFNLLYGVKFTYDEVRAIREQGGTR